MQVKFYSKNVVILKSMFPINNIQTVLTYFWENDNLDIY